MFMQERIGLINYSLNALAKKAAPKGPLHGTAAARAAVNARCGEERNNCQELCELKQQLESARLITISLWHI